MDPVERTRRFYEERAAIALREARLAEDQRRAAVAAFKFLGRGKTPSGRIILAIAIANESLRTRQELAQESQRRGPPPDLATRRW